MKIRIIVCLLTLSLCAALTAAEPPQAARPQLFFWVWWTDHENHWWDLIDLAAEEKMDGIVIWGLKGWKGDGQQCRDVVNYAHARGVKIIHGFGLNGYEEGQYIVGCNPELAAVMPPALAETERAKMSRECVFCPSKPESMELLKQCLLRAADTGIDGFNFETADVDFITCHCPECEKRFQSADETAYCNKPDKWPIAHLNYAAEVLSKQRPGLWLNCEFAMHKFDKAPSTDCEKIMALNRQIDPRITVVWAEHTAPPDKIAKKLRADRENLGFYIRSRASGGRDAKKLLSAQELRPIAQRLLALDPVCIFYRSYRPIDRFGVNIGTAALLLRNPQVDNARLEQTAARLAAECKTGGRYAMVRRIAPGNLIAPDGPAELSVSERKFRHGVVTVTAGHPSWLLDGIADPNDGVWHTMPDASHQAWAVAQWPQPTAVDRVRLFHQSDRMARSLDYTVQYDKDGQWRDLPGMPSKDNAVHGWVEHRFNPLTTTRLRLLITRSSHDELMGMGEWEVYGPDK